MKKSKLFLTLVALVSITAFAKAQTENHLKNNNSDETRLRVSNTNSQNGGLQLGILASSGSGNAGYLNLLENQYFYFSTNGIERMRILNDGKIGIGTPAPNTLLDVNGELTVRTVNQNDALTRILVTDPVTGLVQWRDAASLTGGDNDWIINGTDMYSNTSVTEVGIGTTQPGHLLHLAADDNDVNTEVGFPKSRLLIQNTSSTDGNYSAIYFGNQIGQASAGIMSINHNANGTSPSSTNARSGELRFATSDGNGLGEYRTRMVIKDNGFVGIAYLASTFTPSERLHVQGNIYATGTITELSDQRFKRNITNLNNSLGKILKLRGVSYFMRYEEYKNRGFDKTKQLGLIAQEVEEVVPELVKTYQDGSKAISYTKLIPLLIESIKAQNKKIEALEKQLRTNQSTVKQATAEKIEAKLFQNHPNPFDKETKIDFKIPSEASSAALYVYNMQGQQIRKFDITERGKGQAIIKGQSLKAGMYIYSLIVDSKEVGTKRMILTK